MNPIGLQTKATPAAASCCGMTFSTNEKLQAHQDQAHRAANSCGCGH